MSATVEQALSLVRTLGGCGFWGSLEIKFEDGSVVLLKKTETVKPGSNNQRSNRGGENGHKY